MLDHALKRQLSTHAAHLRAAIFDIGFGDRELIDLNEAGLDPVDEFERPREVLRPDHGREPIVRVVGFPKHFVEIIPARHGRDGSENLIATNVGFRRQAFDQRRAVEVAVLESGNASARPADQDFAAGG